MSDEPVKRRFFNSKVDFNNPQEKSKWMMDLSAMLDDLVGAASPAWTTPPFVAGNFTASGSMTWTVDPADSVTMQYMIIGKMMLVSFEITASSVLIPLSNILRIKIPGGKTAASAAVSIVYLLDAGTRRFGFCRSIAGQTNIDILRDDVANFTESSNTTDVYGQIFFEIQ